jgi:hypothetical protein
MASREKLVLGGGCYCGRLRYELVLGSKDEARTSLCHCGNCKKAFGGVFGVTVKVEVAGFRYLDGEAKVCGFAVFCLWFWGVGVCEGGRGLWDCVLG